MIARCQPAFVGMRAKEDIGRRVQHLVPRQVDQVGPGALAGDRRAAGIGDAIGDLEPFATDQDIGHLKLRDPQVGARRGLYIALDTLQVVALELELVDGVARGGAQPVQPLCHVRASIDATIGRTAVGFEQDMERTLDTDGQGDHVLDRVAFAGAQHRVEAFERGQQVVRSVQPAIARDEDTIVPAFCLGDPRAGIGHGEGDRNLLACLQVVGQGDLGEFEVGFGKDRLKLGRGDVVVVRRPFEDRPGIEVGRRIGTAACRLPLGLPA